MIKIGPSKDNIPNEVCIEDCITQEDVDEVCAYIVAQAKLLPEGEYHTLMVGENLRKDARKRMNDYLMRTERHTALMRKIKIVEMERA